MSCRVVVTGGFDDLRSRHVRFLQEASRYGEVTVWLWSDSTYASIVGQPPKFPLAERQYLLESLRFTRRVLPMEEPCLPDSLPAAAGRSADLWIADDRGDSSAKKAWCDEHGLGLWILRDADLADWPISGNDPNPDKGVRDKVIVTGCYDWFHSGHVRFFEEASQLGDLYVAVGHDANIRLLKGDGHPMFPQEERRYMVHSVRFVHGTCFTSGYGWMDAAPEIERLHAGIYVVNEDGDVPEKREYCARRGIRYVVLQRTPKEGLPRRISTRLRGF